MWSTGVNREQTHSTVSRHTCSAWLTGTWIWQFCPCPQTDWPSLRLFWLLPSRHSFSFNGSKSPAVKISGKPCCCFLELSIMVRAFWRQAASSRSKAQFAEQQRPALRTRWSLVPGPWVPPQDTPITGQLCLWAAEGSHSSLVPSLTCKYTPAAGSPKLSPTLGGRAPEARCWNPTPFPSQPPSPCHSSFPHAGYFHLQFDGPNHLTNTESSS